MTFIEGIGDEVTAFFVILTVIILATLVTFIGSGPHLYSPVHTRTLQISVISGRELAEESSIQIPPEEIRAARNNNQNTSLTANQSYNQQPPNNDQEPRHNGQEHSHNDNNQQETNVLNSDESPPHETEETSHDSEDDQSRRTEEQEMFTSVEEPAPSAPVEETAHGGSSPGQGMRVRLKYLDDTERTVRSTPLTKVAEFKRVHFSGELSSRKIVRLIFCGHLLRDSATLGHYRVKDNSVLHVQVLPQPQSPQSAPQQPSQGGEMPDLAPLLWPLLTLTLGLLWAAYIKYPHLFSTLSLSCLFIFTAGLFAFYRHR